MIKFHERRIDIDENLIKSHEEHYENPFEMWRVENYIRQELRDANTPIEMLLNRLSGKDLKEIIEAGIEVELKAATFDPDTATCSINDPNLSK